MQTIIPFLWFDHQAKEAVQFYTSIFKNSKKGAVARYNEESAKASGQPKGSVLTVEFQLEGQTFTALNGGPIFKFTPAISFAVSYNNAKDIDALWEKLVDGGQVLMPLQQYPFSEKYGWLQDKYGLSWQLNLAKRDQVIAPFVMFVGEQYGKAEEAIKHYMSLFSDSKMLEIHRNDENATALDHAVFTLSGQECMAADSGIQHKFTTTPAISFLVNCETQEQIDHLWNALSAVKEAEQCGWLQDKYGVSWQIVPSELGKMITDKDPEKSRRAMHAMLQMKKIDLQTLKDAYAGK